MPMAGKGLVKLLEELGELGQVAAKKLAYLDVDDHPDGDGSLGKRMEQEMGDVMAAIAFVQEQLGLENKAITERANVKLKLFRVWTTTASPSAPALDS